MLSAYSARCLAVLSDLLPEMAAVATEKGEEFEIKLTTPAGWDFWLSSEEEERLTVGFDEYHCHFGGFSEDTPEKDAAEAAFFVQKLRNNELLLVVWYQNGNYVGSQPIEPHDKPQPLESELQQTFQIKKWAD